jgi:hypothetical protein
VGPALTGPAERAAAAYLALADRLLPGRVTALYLVGSAALGAFRPGRSDVDLVVVVDGDVEVRRLRALHLLSGARTSTRALAAGHGPLTGTCNAVFVRAGDLRRPVTEIRPVGAHTGHEVSIGKAFDVNPVGWKVLRERGIAVRGPAPTVLGLDPQPELLRQWNLDNLASYWRPWAERALRERRPRTRLRPRWGTAWGVLGPPRLHHTIATGDVVAKEDAGAYALDTFDRRWHPVIREAVAYRLGHRADPAFADPVVRREQTARFALEVVDDARRR